MSLKLRLVALVAGALLISLCAGATLIVASALRWVQAEIAVEAEVARQLVEARVAENRDEGEPAERIFDLMRSLEAEHQIHARYIPLTESPAPPGNTTGLMPTVLAWLGVHQTVQEVPVEISGLPGGRVVITTDPAGAIPKVVGAIEVGLVGIFSFAGLTLALVAAGLNRSLRPLGTLASALSQIESGDYKARVGASGPSEIAQLGRHFDAMAARLQEMQTRARALTSQLLSAQERERRELARDLHDELGPCLLAASLDVSALKRLNRSDRRDAVEDCAHGLGALLESMQNLVRRMIARSHVESTEAFDLGSAVQDLATFWQERCPDLSWRIDPPEAWRRVPAALSRPLYRVVQEALSNAVRHSGCTTITVSCRRNGSGVIAEVIDDGSGIMEDAAPGHGIKGMRERLEAIGGALAVASAPGAGTAIRALIGPVDPLPADHLDIGSTTSNRAVA